MSHIFPRPGLVWLLSLHSSPLGSFPLLPSTLRSSPLRSSPLRFKDFSSAACSTMPSSSPAVRGHATDADAVANGDGDDAALHTCLTLTLTHTHTHTHEICFSALSAAHTHTHTHTHNKLAAMGRKPTQKTGRYLYGGDYDTTQQGLSVMSILNYINHLLKNIRL